IKSIMYGTADVTRRLRVLSTDTAELRITMTAPKANPVRVTGKVIGPDASAFDRREVVAVNLNAPNFAALRAAVRPSGEFEFPEVFPAEYTASVSGVNVPSPAVKVVVKKADVKNVAIEFAPRIPGRVIVEGTGPIPALLFRTKTLGSKPITTP